MIGSWITRFARLFWNGPERLPELLVPPTHETDLKAKRTLIVPDIYPPNHDDPHTPELEMPPFEVLPGLAVAGKEVAGCYLKASEGGGWGARNEDWFRRCWRLIREAGGDRYGHTFFRGAYHYLRFTGSTGTKQAEYHLRLIEEAGGFDGGELIGMVDIEEGGQSPAWCSGPLREQPKAEKLRLAGDVRRTTEAYVRRWKDLTGLRIAAYGRGIYRDLDMQLPDMFGADAIVNPAYTSAMPSMARYGVPTSKIAMWQLSGGAGPSLAGYPRMLPGWGSRPLDYSVHINGSKPTSWSTFYRDCLARPR